MGMKSHAEVVQLADLRCRPAVDTIICRATDAVEGIELFSSILAGTCNGWVAGHPEQQDNTSVASLVGEFTESSNAGKVSKRCCVHPYSGVWLVKDAVCQEFLVGSGIRRYRYKHTGADVHHMWADSVIRKHIYTSNYFDVKSVSITFSDCGVVCDVQVLKLHQCVITHRFGCPRDVVAALRSTLSCLWRAVCPDREKLSCLMCVAFAFAKIVTRCAQHARSLRTCEVHKC